MRVVMAEDNTLLRDGLRLVLAAHGIDVVAAVDNATDLLAAVATTTPDLAIVDVRMPPTFTDEGVRAALDIRSRYRGTAVLVFSQWVETSYARDLMAGDTGGIGYLLKDRVTQTDAFIDAVCRVADGGTALDPDVVHQLLGGGAADPGIARLSPREREVLGLLAEGRTNQAIADQLFLALRSVEKIVASVFIKLDLPPRPDDHRRVLAVLRHLRREI